MQTVGRYSHPVDAKTIINTAMRRDERQKIHPSEGRLDLRALNLLYKLGYIQLDPSGYGYQQTAEGKQALSSDLQVPIQAEWLEEWLEIEDLADEQDARRISSEVTLSSLSVENWRQFKSVEISFHPRLTILTGANGAGKTTLLNILGPHFAWTAQLLTRGPDSREPTEPLKVGMLRYTNGVVSPLVQQVSQGVSSAPIAIPHIQAVPGVFINSHRSISSYQQLKSLPSKFSEWSSLQEEFRSEIHQRYSGSGSQRPPLHRMKEALIAAAMYAYGNPAVEADDSAKEVWEGYQNVLQNFLPSSLGFSRLRVQAPELLIVTHGAEFPLEAVSGGIGAMLELSWQIFLRQRGQDAFTVCIDEPENHLHPELQRSIVPSLLAAFPDVTFIVATHSPLVVTSSPDSNVYALARNDEGQIESRLIETMSKSETADATLVSVLGLDTALPIWAERRLQDLLDALPVNPSIEDMRALRGRLEELGLDRQFPAAVDSLGFDA
ncbi:hypothetical protein C5E10_13380 [Pseudoclavibacter sp. RFBG4]|nr:hypothetical protein C5E10_13380 [Pseudoclavibacter sp. RFBG4]